MFSVRVGEEKNGFLERLYLGIHFMYFNVRLELSEVVHGAFAVSGSDDIRRVPPNVQRDLAPSRFNSSDGVGQGTILAVFR